jgi:iron complex transport system permease protein
VLSKPSINAYSTEKWLFLGLFLGLLLFINLSMGSVNIPLPEIVKALMGFEIQHKIWADIIIDFRLTKALTCVLAGSALAVAGLQMQTLFRNALAGPDILGLSSGASLAVSLVFMSGAAGLSLLPSSFSIALAACLGSGAILLLVLAIAGRVRDNTSLLIVGLMIGAGTASLVSVLQFMSRAEDQQYYLIWTFGSLGGLDWNELLILFCALIIGFSLIWINIKPLNAWVLGDYYAMSLGIRLKRSKLLMILSTSILAGAVTAFCGPIAFVGLAVPHLVRLLFNTNNHKTLLPAVAIGGASLLLLCDSIAQLPTYILPINVVTALIGAPVVVWVILRGKKVYV